MSMPICSSPVGLQFVECGDGANQRHTAARNNAFLDRRFGGVHGIFDASFLFLHLGLGCRAHLDLGDAADQLGEPFLSFSRS